MYAPDFIDVKSMIKTTENGFPRDAATLPAPRIDHDRIPREIAATMTLAIAHGFTPEQIANLRHLWNEPRFTDLLPFTEHEIENRAEEWNRLRVAAGLMTWDRDEGLAFVDLMLEVLDPPKAPRAVHHVPMSADDALCLELETADCDDGRIVRCHARPDVKVCRAPETRR